MWFKQPVLSAQQRQIALIEVLADKLAQSEFAHCQGLTGLAEGFATPVSFRLSWFSLPLHLACGPEKKKKSPARRRHP